MSTLELLHAIASGLGVLIFWGGVILVSWAAWDFLIEGAKLFQAVRERVERTRP